MMAVSAIQVDLFEVQLGAGLLLQFKTTEGQIIRVLADGGEFNDVNTRLPFACAAFSDGPTRLDLVIGTHYDADHLDGLGPIINNKMVEIGEAWLPPVANDTEIHPQEEPVTDEHLLVFQFAFDEERRTLRHYLETKQAHCEEIQVLERIADQYRETTRKFTPQRAEYKHSLSAAMRDTSPNDWLEQAGQYFKLHRSDADLTLGEGYHHADQDILWPPDLEGPLGGYPYRWHHQRLMKDRLEFFREQWTLSGELAEAHARSLAYLRRAAANDAINAISLAKVVEALRRRDIPIRCHMINAGQPRRFVWSATLQRFVTGSQLSGNELELQLLGPSIDLVKRHWDRLPVGVLMERLAFRSIPLKAITPSNQLSYILRLGFLKQGILVSGDAGCVDFSPNPQGKYYPSILNALLPLHVIQVAHHGGRNAHFYRVLLAAKYAEQKARSFLLLSHALDDLYRPSREFAMFMEAARNDTHGRQILFTCRPRAMKVRDYIQEIHPVVGTTAPTGDVRLMFKSRAWRVLQHAVQV